MSRTVLGAAPVAALLAAALLAPATSAFAMQPVLVEQQMARSEEAMILARPIAGIENKYWFNYRVNVVEAQKELSSDLRRASDLEDRRDAWEEYAHELRHERASYVRKMEKKGFRTGAVFVGG